MTVFVTGGSGIVGRSLVSRLIAEGTPVRALARSAESAGDLRSLGAEPIVGDLSDVPALLAGMRGTDAVFHVAGLNAMWFIWKLNPQIADWEPHADTPSAAKVVAIVSLGMWVVQFPPELDRAKHFHWGWGFFVGAVWAMPRITHYLGGPLPLRSLSTQFFAVDTFLAS